MERHSPCLFEVMTVSAISSRKLKAVLKLGSVVGVLIFIHQDVWKVSVS